jgi:phage terminase small subunit
MTDALTDKQRLYVENISRGMESRAAARAAGYSESFSRVAAFRLGKNPVVVDAVEAIQAKLRKKTLFTQGKAIEEIDAQIKGALGAKHPAHMAAAQLLTLKCKIHGYVREKVEIEHADLRGSLEAAKTRVLTVINVAPKPSEVLTDARVTVLSPAVGVSVDGSIKWVPHITGEKAQ